MIDEDALFDRLCSVKVDVQPELPKRITENWFKGKKFVFTGKLSHYTRHEAHNIVESYGGQCSGSVTGSTNFLVTADDGSNFTKKINDAKNKGVSVMTEADFVEKVNEHELFIAQGY